MKSGRYCGGKNGGGRYKTKSGGMSRSTSWSNGEIVSAAYFHNDFNEEKWN